MGQIEIKKTELFKVKLSGKWINRTEVLTNEGIEFHRKYSFCDVQIVENLGDKDYTSLRLTLDGGYSSNCYIEQYYTLVSDRELSEDDFINLRAMELFLNGQENGKVTSKLKENDKFIYKLRSVRDSGD